ncbi:MAG TPA: CBS domain-containing protein [Anaerolineae bacterium]|nr:CBS domain-containing protein [Anaerolineae bacterium]
MKTAADVMTKQVVDISPDATVAEAIVKMKQSNVTSLLVQRRSASDTWGFVSQTDIVEKVIAEGAEPEQTLVRDIMTKRVITVSPNFSLMDCAALMARADIRRVLVFDGQDIVGIVSGSDIFSAL